MKNHWIKDVIKEGDALDTQHIKNAMDERKILKLARFGRKKPYNVEFKPFLYELNQHIKVNVETGTLTGFITDRYSTDDGLNWYNISLDKIWQGYDNFVFAEHRVQHCNDWNIVREYIPGREKLFDHNYQVTAEENPQITLNPESFMPQKTLNIDLKLKYDGQHDGRLWTPDWKEKCDKRLVEEIMSDLKQQVEEFVARVNPFSIHC